MELMLRAPEKVQAIFAEVLPIHVQHLIADMNIYVIGYCKRWGPDKTPVTLNIDQMPVFRPVFDDAGQLARWVECDGPHDWKWVCGS
jgi:hypothetical protein